MPDTIRLSGASWAVLGRAGIGVLSTLLSTPYLLRESLPALGNSRKAQQNGQKWLLAETSKNAEKQGFANAGHALLWLNSLVNPQFRLHFVYAFVYVTPCNKLKR